MTLAFEPPPKKNKKYSYNEVSVRLGRLFPISLHESCPGIIGIIRPSLPFLFRFRYRGLPKGQRCRELRRREMAIVVESTPPPQKN